MSAPGSHTKRCRGMRANRVTSRSREYGFFGPDGTLLRSSPSRTALLCHIALNSIGVRWGTVRERYMSDEEQTHG